MESMKKILEGINKKPSKTPTLNIPIKSAIEQAVGQVTPTIQAEPAQLPKKINYNVQSGGFIPPTSASTAKSDEFLKTATGQIKPSEFASQQRLKTISESPFVAGASKGFGDITISNLPGAKEIREQTISTDLSTAKKGEIAGALIKNAMTYAAAGAIAKGAGVAQGVTKSLTPKLGEKGAQFATTILTDQVIDNIAQTPFTVIEGIKADKTIPEVGKDVLVQNVIDLAFNTAFAGAGEGFKKIKELYSKGDDAVKASVEKTIKTLPESQQKTIQEELGIDKEVTAQQFMKEQEKLAQDIDIENYYKRFDETQPVIKPVQEEIPKVEQTIVQTEKPVTSEISPRIPDVQQPQVGTSKSGFVKDRDFSTKELNSRIKELELTTTSNEARTQLAKDIVNQDFETAVRLVKEGDQFGSGVESEIGRDVLEKLRDQGRDADVVEVIESMARKFRRSGQDVQAASLWARNTPEGMQKWATTTLKNADLQVDPKLIKEVGEDMRKLVDMSPEELAKVVAGRFGKQDSDFLINQIMSSNSAEQLRALNTAITMDKVFSKIPIAKARTLSTIQSISYLLNARTFNRNILGNTASISGEIISKVPASMADRALSMFTGNRTVVSNMPKFKQALNEGWKQGKRSFFEISAGVNKAQRDKYDLMFGSAFKSKIGKNLEKTLSLSLQTPDEFFKGFSKADSLYNQLYARLGKSVNDMSFDEILEKSTVEEIQNAVKEAEFATFQNDSWLADFLSATKSHLNRIHIDPNKKFGKEVGEFGLGDLVIKFTRVPGNIITRGFEYSPIGYAKIAHAIMQPDLIKNLSAQEQRALAMQFGRATTGTGLLGIGYLLNKAGIITGTETSKDYDVQAFNSAEGLGDYKVNVSALERFITGGSTEKQAGDVIKSYNWAQPMTIPIAVGARIASEQPETAVDTAKAIKNATIEEALDLPTLFIFQKMMYEQMSDDATLGSIISVPVKEALPGFVPSVVRQTSQAIDPVVRDISNAEYKTLARIQANIPALPGIPEKYTSKGLPPKLDVLGREVTRQKGVIPNLIDPASTSEYTPTEYGDVLRTISELSGKTSVFPDRKPPNTVTIGGDKVQLTQEEKQRWQKTEGQYVDEQYTKLLQNKTITSESDAIRYADVLERIKRNASDTAKLELIRNRRK